jgi:hypothetical protein
MLLDVRYEDIPSLYIHSRQNGTAIQAKWKAVFANADPNKNVVRNFDDKYENQTGWGGPMKSLTRSMLLEETNGYVHEDGCVHVQVSLLDMSLYDQ